MRLAELVSTSAAVASTRSRKAKVAALAGTLARAEPEELETVTAYLSGTLRQRRVGVGWRSLADLPEPAGSPSLGVTEVHERLDEISRFTGAGSQSARAAAVAGLFERATAEEQSWLRGAITGEVRQGASDALVQDAVAAAAGVPVAQVRRAAMFAGATLPVAVAALSGGSAALEEFRLEVGRPVLPMLASSAPDLSGAWEKLGGQAPLAVDHKLDGIRIQAHKDGERVLLVTRSLEDITDRLPGVAAVVRALPADRVVLDGEALALGPDGRPRPFQETASITSTGIPVDAGPTIAAGADTGPEAGAVPVAVITPYFFDLLLRDDLDLLDAPAAQRWRHLEDLVPAAHRVPRLVTADAVAAAGFLAEALAAGQEGVVVKSTDAPYAAGRRGSAWVKVKPVHTLDLVVLAVERGNGRRRGWLSNIHLGARDPSTGGFVMLGKTFKGMTDEMLAWQTARFEELATSRDDWVVHVRPEQVVEIAFDGIQRSTRYPGGVALRFARVVRYRDDKSAAEADTIEDVRAMYQG
ncbi:ATP-dependent DNA ligase [Occultella glacieicola]|uniref:DNA ligase n=1 Tax=Occultella glacieicola TaxID=2518684 RepID=A0ABY2E5F6_9MICO|nr:ATP-dependent DNA ligase [Occultella glacieicola]TDE95827.1 ATP-dependent DNA ligase [Occultella glacieicola]